MAEKTNEELLKEIAALKAEKKALESEKEALAETVSAIEDAGVTNPVVQGSVKLKLEQPDGKTITKTVGIRNGRKTLRLANGNIVPSETFLKVCNGKELNDDEKLIVKAQDMTQDSCLAHLTNLVVMGASMIIEK